MTKQEIAEANRRRYEELRAAGQGATPKALPVATALDGAPLAPDAVVASETRHPFVAARVVRRRTTARTGLSPRVEPVRLRSRSSPDTPA